MPRRWEVTVVVAGWVYAPGPEEAAFAVQQAVRGATEPEVVYSRVAGIVQRIPIEHVFAQAVEELGPENGGETLPEGGARLLMDAPEDPNV